MTSKRKNRKSSGSSATGISPVEKRAREFNSSSNSPTELGPMEDVFEMPESLNTKLDCILTRLEGIDSKLETINTVMASLEAKFNKLEGRVAKLEKEIVSTRDAVKELQDGVQECNLQVGEATTAASNVKEHCENRLKELEDKLLYAEVYQRRENLRFYGVAEEKEGEDSRRVLEAFLEQQCGIHPEGIEFQRVHRVGKPHVDGSPRAIIARFLRYGDRESIFSKANLLKNTGFRMSADLPREIVNRRKLQSLKLVEARKAGKMAFFRRAEPDKLYIDRVLHPL